MGIMKDIVQGFKVVNLQIGEKDGIFQMFWKPHQVRALSICKPGGKTLFVINVPSFVTDTTLANSMEVFGCVVNVLFHKKPTTGDVRDAQFPILFPKGQVDGYRVAYVIFEKSDSVVAAMQYDATKPFVIANELTDIYSGMGKWYTDYNSQFVTDFNLRGELESVVYRYEKLKRVGKGSKIQSLHQKGMKGKVKMVLASRRAGRKSFVVRKGKKGRGTVLKKNVNSKVKPDKTRARNKADKIKGGKSKQETKGDKKSSRPPKKEGEETKQKGEEKKQKGDDKSWTIVCNSDEKPQKMDKLLELKKRLMKTYRKKKSKNLINFYAFQRKEQHLQKMDTTRKRFEEDIKRMQMLRENKSFAPDQ